MKGATMACCNILVRLVLMGGLVLLVGSTVWSATPDPYVTAAKVDALIEEEIPLAAADLSPRVDDERFLRRVSLDLIGDLPTPEDVIRFAIDPSEDKRSAAVDRLLDHPQFGQNWARYWRDVVMSRRIEESSLLVANPLVVHLTEQFNEGIPWSRIAAGFITATGDIREDGRTAIFAAQEGRTEETTSELVRIFLGIQIQCAQCHDHVTDQWKRTQFHEMAAFFPRVGQRRLRTITKRTFVVFAVDHSQRRAPQQQQSSPTFARAHHAGPG